jgi:hypothetical protein
MSILIDATTPVIVQGFTGAKATFHAKEMIDYGTKVVGGVTPGKGGQRHLDRPIFNTVKDAVRATGAQASLAFVPPPFAADALMEAADAGLRLVCIITDAGASAARAPNREQRCRAHRPVDVDQLRGRRTRRDGLGRNFSRRSAAYVRYRGVIGRAGAPTPRKAVTWTGPHTPVTPRRASPRYGSVRAGSRPTPW